MSLSSSIHNPRVFNFAIIDVIGTVAIAYIIWKYTPLQRTIGFPVFCAVVFLAGIIAHRISGIDTTLGYILGLNGRPVRYRNNPPIIDYVGVYHD
jgi:hypothetical protein